MLGRVLCCHPIWCKGPPPEQGNGAKVRKFPRTHRARHPTQRYLPFRNILLQQPRVRAAIRPRVDSENAIHSVQNDEIQDENSSKVTLADQNEAADAADAIAIAGEESGGRFDR